MNKEKKLKIARDGKEFFDKIVWLYIYWAIIWLISYMISSLVFKFYNFLWRHLESTQTSKELVWKEDIQYSLLHDIAFTIVLVKAYIILMEYAKTRHINIKYILEIAIIAPVVEIVFNYSSYDFKMIVFYGVFAVLMSIIYLIFYKNLRIVEEDYKQEHYKKT